MTTTDLSDFGHRELEMLEELLCAMRTQGLPNDFDDCEVTPVMNRYSGNVFLSNSEYQVAMMNGDKLESFHTLSYSGEEGFADELYDLFQDGAIDFYDLEQLAAILEEHGRSDEKKSRKEKRNQKLRKARQSYHTNGVFLPEEGRLQFLTPKRSNQLFLLLYANLRINPTS